MSINTKQGLAPVATTIIVLIVIALAAWAIYAAKEPETSTEENGTGIEETTLREMTFALAAQNNSGQNGTAVMSEIDSDTISVALNLSNATSTPEPAHIHAGVCPNPGAVKYPLTNVVNGTSVTDINIPFDDLTNQGALAINVHKSAAELNAYVACGDVPGTTGTSTVSTTGGTDQASALATGSKVTVNYTASGFSPKTVTVKKGDTVVFENKTGKAASVASDPHPTHTTYAEFDQYKTAQRGQTTFSFTFDKVGAWNYHDHLNANMAGTVVVTE